MWRFRERAASDEVVLDEGIPAHRPRWRKKRWAVPFVLLALLITLGLAAWFSRESIADDIIRKQLENYDIPATYNIERIGGRTQILTDVVVGDPNNPDFTADRVLVTLRHRLGLPEIGGVSLVNPRIYGSFRDGNLSFGSLDSLIFAETGKAPGLPNLKVSISDGRGLLRTDWGPVGLKVEGKGVVSHGWSGILAATAPQLDFGDCDVRGATAYGAITTSSGEPKFSGPVRLASLGCEKAGLSLADYAMDTEVSTDDRLANIDVKARLDGGRTQYGDNLASALIGTIRARFGDTRTTAKFTLAGREIQTPQALAAVLTAEGQLRANQGFSNIQLESNLEGNGLRLGPQMVSTLEGLSSSGDGTLIAPIVRRVASSLQAETRGSALEATVRFRKNPKGYSLLAPQAELRGGSGARILSLSRFEVVGEGDAPPRLAGNIATGGPNLPRITGRMERSSSGGAIFRLAMERYEAEGSALAIPQLVLAQGESGALGFSGRIEATGPLPGGSTSNLVVPIDGRYLPGGELTLWSKCTDFSFDRLEVANLRLDKRGLTLCPARGRPILTNGPEGLRIAAGAPSLDLVGSLGETPIRLSSGPVGFAYPGALTAREIDVALGPEDTASRFRISDLKAQFGKDIAGTFADAEVKLASVPLDIANAGGDWNYADGALTISGASFRLSDRNEPDRFEPLESNDGKLTLVDNKVNAEATLRHPGTQRVVTLVDIHHDLSTGAGQANLDVPGIAFDSQLQPDQLTHLALGVIANADGTITGTGRINWFADGNVTSSGEFSTDDLDFAAAFGPVKGASGTVVFTDLLNLTTAPNQKLHVASVNPGIEVLDGEVEFELVNGTQLVIAGGNWPFMGGRLMLREVEFNLGVSEERRYIFEIIGLKADQFVTQMEIENLAATGTFDGTVPIVFDTQGNGKIDTGVLISRPPGGNISYVGELTYKDLTPIANFAFDALKSLDYDQMRIIMEGPLTGEIVTRVRFDGVSQGEGAKSNFITRRLAAIPLQFRINIRAQFYQLLTSMKSLYDPSAVRDPRELGLLSDDGKRLLRRSITGEEAEPDIDPEDIIPDEPVIQDQESE